METTSNIPEGSLAPGTFVWQFSYDDDDIRQLATLLESALATFNNLADRMKVFGDDAESTYLTVPWGEALSAIGKIYDFIGLFGQKYDPSTMPIAISGSPRAGFSASVEGTSANEFFLVLLNVIREMFHCGFDGHFPVPGKYPFPDDSLMLKFRWIVDKFRIASDSTKASGADAELETQGSKSGQVTESGSTQKLTPSESQCLDTIRDNRRRMTCTELLIALQESDRTQGLSTAKLALSRLMRMGLITNRTDVRPRGYGLPEWD